MNPPELSQFQRHFKRTVDQSDWQPKVVSGSASKVQVDVFFGGHPCSLCRRNKWKKPTFSKMIPKYLI